MGFVPPVTWPGVEPWQGRFVFVFLLDTWINSCRGHKSSSHEQSIEVNISQLFDIDPCPSPF